MPVEHFPSKQLPLIDSHRFTGDTINMDWNWFFSSVAQSVAALAGIFGAFIISKLLNNEAAFARSQSETTELLRESDRLVDEGKLRPFEWYNKRTIEYALYEIGNTFKDADIDSAAEYYKRFDFPEYLPKQESLKAIEQLLDKERARRAQQRAKKEARAMGGVGMFDLAAPAPFLSSEVMASIEMGNLAHWQDYEREREAIRRWVLAAKSHGQAVNEHLEAIEKNPERFSVIRVSLAVILLLFWTGVVYPLVFLPVPLNWTPRLSVMSFFDVLFSFQGAILTIITLVFSGLIVWLVVLNESLRHNPA